MYPRPSHADYTYLAKYGVKASSGGGRASARETVGRVAAGAIAEKYLQEACGVEIVAFVGSVGKVELPFASGDDEVLGKDFLELLNTVTRAEVDKELTRCPHKETSAKMEAVSRLIMDCPSFSNAGVRILELIICLGYPRCQSQNGLTGRYRHLCHPKLSPWSRRTSIRQIRGHARTRHVVHPIHKGLRDRIRVQGDDVPR